jgi:acyl-CoA synthetase (AMP-forming)/AMP-acid ligase II
MLLLILTLMNIQEDDNVDEVVAMLAPANLDYVITVFALSRLGYSLLLLSNRLPTEAYISLLQNTGCTRIFSTPNFEKHVTAARAELKLEYFNILTKSAYDLPLPSGPYFTRAFDGRSENERTAFIIHSSGSTGLPKPIYQNHKSALMNYSSGLGYKAFLTLPLYHNHGMSCFFRAVYSGNEIAFHNSNLPITGRNLVAAMEKIKPGGFHGVPYALKLLSESQRGIELLRSCNVVMFGGSSCPDDLGDRLVKAGINLIAHYGA